MKIFAPLHVITDPARPVSRVTFIVLAVVCLVLDQVSKLIMVANLEYLIPVPIIPNFLDLRLTYNTGAAWSFLSGHPLLLAMCSIAISAVIIYVAWTRKPGEEGMRIGLGLILGGALGNLIDRLRLEYVVDFIDAHWFDQAHWPIFNIADSAICVGIALLIIATFYPVPDKAPKAGKQK